MNKEEQVMMGFRDLLKKTVWLNKFKMEDSLKHSIYHRRKRPLPRFIRGLVEKNSSNFVRSIVYK